MVPELTGEEIGGRLETECLGDDVEVFSIIVLDILSLSVRVNQLAERLTEQRRDFLRGVVREVDGLTEMGVVVGDEKVGKDENRLEPLQRALRPCLTSVEGEVILPAGLKDLVDFSARRSELSGLGSAEEKLDHFFLER